MNPHLLRWLGASLVPALVAAFPLLQPTAGQPAGAKSQAVLREERAWQTAETCYTLARLLRQRGQASEPERLLREGLKVARENLGPVDYRASLLADELVELLIENGRAPDAEQVCLQTLAVQHEQDPRHQQESATFWAYQRLAAVYTRVGKAEQARQTLQDALAACIEHAGAESDLALTARAALGRTLYAHGGQSLLEARRVLTEVAAALRERRGSDAPIALAAQADLALILLELGLLEQAEITARQAFALERLRPDSDRFQISVTVPQLVSVLRRRAKLVDAARILDDELQRRRYVRGPVHPETLTIAEGLAQVLLEQGRGGEAEPMVRDCVRARSGVSWTSRRDLALSKLLLGECLAAAGGHAEAEPLVLDAVGIVLREAVPSAPLRKEVVERVVDFYQGWTGAGADKSAQAQEWRARLDESSQEAASR